MFPKPCPCLHVFSDWQCPYRMRPATSRIHCRSLDKHCALCSDALVTDLLYFSEVVIGSVELIMSFVPKNAAKLRKVFDFKYFLLVFQQKIFRIVCRFMKMHYLCNDKSRPLPIRTAYPAGHFLYIDMRYTKQAMTLAQQFLSEAPTHTV